MIPRKDPFGREEEPAGQPARGIHAEKRVEGETVGTHGLGEHTGSPSDISAADEDHGHAITQDVFMLPTQDAHDAILDDWPHNTAGTANEVAFIWHVPAEWTGFNTVSVVMIPDATEELTADIDVSVATLGEDYNADTRQSLDETLDVTASDITEWPLVNIGTLFGGIQPNDVIAIRFQSDIDTMRILGLHINYGIGSAATGGGASAHGDLSGVTSDQHHTEAHAADHAKGQSDDLAAQTIEVTTLEATTIQPDSDDTGNDITLRTNAAAGSFFKIQTHDGSGYHNILNGIGGNGVFNAKDYLTFGAPIVWTKSTETIDAGTGEITTPTTSLIYLTSAGATDSLEAIVAPTLDATIVFLTPTAGKDITLVHDGTVTAGKKLMINGEANVTMDEDHDFAIAIYDATATVWNVMVPGSGGGAHGPSSHTEGNADKALYLDSSGDEQEVSLVAAGSATLMDRFYRSTSATGAPDFTEIEQSVSITIETPAADDNITIKHFSFPVTIREVHAIVIGTGSDDVTFNLYMDATRTTETTKVFSASKTLGDGTTMTRYTPDTAAIAENDIFFIDISAVTGSPTELHLTIRYTTT